MSMRAASSLHHLYSFSFPKIWNLKFNNLIVFCTLENSYILRCSESTPHRQKADEHDFIVTAISGSIIGTCYFDFLHNKKRGTLSDPLMAYLPWCRNRVHWNWLNKTWHFLETLMYIYVIYIFLTLCVKN